MRTDESVLLGDLVGALQLHRAHWVAPNEVHALVDGKRAGLHLAAHHHHLRRLFMQACQCKLGKLSSSGAAARDTASCTLAYHTAVPAAVARIVAAGCRRVPVPAGIPVHGLGGLHDELGAADYCRAATQEKQKISSFLAASAKRARRLEAAVPLAPVPAPVACQPREQSPPSAVRRPLVLRCGAVAHRVAVDDVILARKKARENFKRTKNAPSLPPTTTTRQRR